MKSFLNKRIIFFLRKIKTKILLRKYYGQDRKRFEKSASLIHQQRKFEQIRARITYYYHSIEKGLSNPNVRLGFGKTAFDGLLRSLNDYVRLGFSQNDTRYLTAISTIHEYIRYHEDKGFNVDVVKKKFKEYLKVDNKLYGGYETVDRSCLNNREKDFALLAKERNSVRTFSNDYVDQNLIYEAIQISMKTPSICNRQPWKTYIVKNKDVQKKILQLQKGFKGYEETLDILIIITVDNRYLLGINERNQGFIAGGMFSMSLLYSLEYVGLAACALNAALSYESEKSLRDVVEISENESLIMFIAVGCYPEVYKVPKSHRDLNSDVTKIL